MKSILTKLSVFLILLMMDAYTLKASESSSGVLRESIVLIHTIVDGRKQEDVTGFVVQSDRYNGYLVARASLLAGNDSFRVPYNQSEYLAQITFIDKQHDLAILKVNGLELPPLTFALQDQVGSAGVWLAGEDDLLVNSCGEVTGLRWANTEVVHSAQNISKVLSFRNVSIFNAEQLCIDPEYKIQLAAQEALSQAKAARQEAEKAQALVEKLETQLELSKENNTALVKLLNDTRRRTEKALKIARSAEKKAQQVSFPMTTPSDDGVLDYLKQDRLEAQNRLDQIIKSQEDSSASRDRLVMILVLVIVILILGLGFVLIRNTARLKPNPEPSEAEKSVLQPRSLTIRDKTTFAEYVLDGRDEDGIRYLLRISGEQMASSDGIVIGRNPKDSPYIINHADVSRKHARLKLMKDRAFIEDLGSTNGTSVNGQAIDEKGPVSVSSGDQIIIGSVVMKLRVLTS